MLLATQFTNESKEKLFVIENNPFKILVQVIRNVSQLLSQQTLFDINYFYKKSIIIEQI